MGAFRVSPALFVLAGMACGVEEQERVEVDLEIVSMTPDIPFLEGEEVTMVTRNGCLQEDATLTISEKAVSDLTLVEPDRWTFTSPAVSGPPWSTIRVQLECVKPANPAHRYGRSVAYGNLIIDFEPGPVPTVTHYSPVGDGVSVLAKASVSFSRDIDLASVTEETFFIEGVAGVVSQDEDRTFLFTPSEPLQPGTEYRVVVRSGGVVSTTGRPLKTTLRPGGGTPDPNKDEWTFTTADEE